MQIKCLRRNRDAMKIDAGIERLIFKGIFLARH